MAASPEPEVRWVGEQHLMRGYCGRAVLVGRAAVAAAAGADGSREAYAGARAYSVRPVALLQRPRHLVVRIGPRAAGGEAAALAEERGEMRARAA